MTTQVRITNPCRSEDGLSILISGSTPTLSDEYARYVVRAFGAVPLGDPGFTQNDYLTQAQRQATQAMVAAPWNSRAQFTALLDSGAPQAIQGYGNSFIGSGVHLRSLAANSGGRLSFLRNSGMNGYTSAQTLAKMQAEGFYEPCKIVALQEGTNDASNTVSVATHVANMRACAQLALAAGKMPFLILCPPTNNGYQALTHSYWLAERIMCESLGVPYFDAFARWTDVTGAYTSGASTDNIHPINSVFSGAGADMAATMLAKSPVPLLPRTNTGLGIMGGNVLQLTDTNADNLPDGWSALSLTGQTYNALSDYTYPNRGKKASVSVSQTATGSLIKQSVYIAGGYTAGDRLRLAGTFGVSAISNCLVSVFVRQSGASASDAYAYASTTTISAGYITAEFNVAPGATQFTIFIQFETATSGAYTATVEFGGFDLYNITANTF